MKSDNKTDTFFDYPLITIKKGGKTDSFILTRSLQELNDALGKLYQKPSERAENTESSFVAEKDASNKPSEKEDKQSFALKSNDSFPASQNRKSEEQANTAVQANAAAQANTAEQANSAEQTNAAQANQEESPSPGLHANTGERGPNGKDRDFSLKLSGKTVIREIKQKDIWSFDVSLPQKIRTLMNEMNTPYAIYLKNGDFLTAYYYTPSMSLSIPAKYLKLFEQDNIEINVNGENLLYFMTNDEKALGRKLSETKLIIPTEKDWLNNAALHKNVIDKMSALGAVYSVFIHNGLVFANKYLDGKIPGFCNVSVLTEIYSQKVKLGFLTNILKNEDIVLCKKIFNNEKTINTPLLNSWTPLMIAVMYNSKTIVKLLIESGADINAQSQKDGLTALMIASGNGFKEIVELLISCGADTGIRAKNGWTALLHALSRNYDDIAELLKEKEKIEIPELNYKNMTFNEILSSFIYKFINKDNKKPSDIYKTNLKGFMSKQTFSKIRSSVSRPSKKNVILLALGMELSLKEAEILLQSAGYILSDKDEADIIIKKHLKKNSYDIYKIDAELYENTKNTLSPKLRR